MEANDSNSGSYAWKSILSARDVIRKGMVWRIGNGQNVRIKEDRWLPGSPRRSILSPLPSVAAETKVQTLINPELGVWRADRVNQLFLPQEADAILGIPLSRRCPPDKIAWGCTPSGVFSTGSAYKLLASEVEDSQAETSNRSAQKQFWKAVWGLRVPNKFKHFLWRACNNALPTMSNLFRRNITPTDQCELCKLYPEDPLHAIWLCREVETVWSSSHCFNQANLPRPQSFSNLLSLFLQVTEDYRKEVFSIAASLLWNRRNAIHFGRPVQAMEQILSTAGNLLQDFLAAQQIELVIPPSSTLQHWTKPDLHYHKVNFDAAMFREAHLAGIGVVVRDWRGEFVGALSSPMSLTNSVAEMEALACRKAVEFAAEIGVQRVIFEGDSAMVINALNQNNAGLSSYGVVIEDTRSQALVFESCAFAHIKRVCNCVADAITKKAKAFRSAQVWLNCPPDDIVSLLMFDVH